MRLNIGKLAAILTAMSDPNDGNNASAAADILMLMVDQEETFVPSTGNNWTQSVWSDFLEEVGLLNSPWPSDPELRPSPAVTILAAMTSTIKGKIICAYILAVMSTGHHGQEARDAADILAAMSSTDDGNAAAIFL